MPTAILGISAYYHDSAAALVVDGVIVAAAQEERFTRRRHDAALPVNAIAYCLREGAIRPDQLDHVVFYEKPLLKFDRLLETYAAVAPAGLRSFVNVIPQWLKTKLHVPREIRRALGGQFTKRIAFTRHHEAHAASAFFPSPYREAAVLTVDGVGEWETATIGHGHGTSLELLQALTFPHSLGLLYTAFTHFAGFRPNSGEYKLMGLAPYGEPRYVDAILQEIVDLKDDGSLAMDMSFFRYCHGQTMTSRKFDQLFGGPPRNAESDISQREKDLAASVQAVTEMAILRMAKTARQLTGSTHLCLAGGVAQNAVAMGKLLRSGIFDDIWIQPAAGDAGGAIGAALFVYHQLLDGERQPGTSDSQRSSLLGPAFSDIEIRAWLDAARVPYTHYPDEAALLQVVAQQLDNQQVVGWFQGRMEFGPRALGARSILADPRRVAMQATLNQVKRREPFRPFAPSVLIEDAPAYFDIKTESPFMTIVAPVTADQLKRSEIPAVTHADGSARVQTVDEHRHGRFWRLIREFKRQTGCPVLINTSFNVRGEPIVSTPQDAYRCFAASTIDLLVLENCVLYRSEQAPADATAQRSYIDSLPLD